MNVYKKIEDHLMIPLNLMPLDYGLNIIADKLDSYKTEIEDLKKQLEEEKLLTCQLIREIDNNRKIIAKELSENDDLGSEFIYIVVLKDEIKDLKKQLEEKQKVIDRLVKASEEK